MVLRSAATGWTMAVRHVGPILLLLQLLAVPILNAVTAQASAGTALAGGQV